MKGAKGQNIGLMIAVQVLVQFARTMNKSAFFPTGDITEIVWAGCLVFICAGIQFANRWQSSKARARLENYIDAIGKDPLIT